MKRIFPLKLSAVDAHDYEFEFQELAGPIRFRFEAFWDENGHQRLSSRELQFVHRIAGDEAGILIDKCVARFDTERLKAKKESRRIPVFIKYLGDLEERDFHYQVGFDDHSRAKVFHEEIVVSYDRDGACKIVSSFGDFKAELNENGYLILREGDEPQHDLLQAILFFDESRYCRLNAQDEIFRLELQYSPSVSNR